MIKCEKGIASIKGTKTELLAELTTLIHFLLEKGVADKEEIKKSVEIAFMSDEERHAAAIEALGDLENLSNFLDDLLEGVLKAAEEKEDGHKGDD